MQVHAIQYRVHKGLINLGIRLAKSTENLSHDGYDNLINEKHFHFKQLFVWCIEDEITALKIKDGLPDNDDE